MPRPGEESSPRTMRCLEVWGGNEAVDQGVVVPGLDAWLYSRPFEGHSAGGDLHYVSSCAAGLVTRVLVADVSGHGEMVSDMARKLRELMRRYVNYIDQTRLVQSLNQNVELRRTSLWVNGNLLDRSSDCSQSGRHVGVSNLLRFFLV